MMAGLSGRERFAVTAAGLVLFLFILFQFFLVPMFAQQSKLKKSVQRKKAQLAEMQLMQQEYAAYSKNNSSIAGLLQKRVPGFSLFSFLEKSADLSDVKKNITSMKPAGIRDDETMKQSMVEMKLQAVSLEQMVSFLKQVESPEKIVAIKRISIQENTKKAGTLDVLLQIVSVDELIEQ
ncbi:MAG: hypothetical protein CSA31_01690 [Desulfobulbus propionicus]|nr:MAG: hypothetical protein CSA31_01690 [Desulfobulbus propionicus]